LQEDNKYRAWFTKKEKRETQRKGKRLSHKVRACTFSFIYLHYFTLFHTVCKIIVVYVFFFLGVFYTYPTSISKIIYTQTLVCIWKTCTRYNEIKLTPSNCTLLWIDWSQVTTIGPSGL
jgi:hypothetical protein